MRKQADIDGALPLPLLNQDTVPMSYCKQNTTIAEIQEYNQAAPPKKNNFTETFVNKYYASMRKMEQNKDQSAKIYEQERVN